MTLPLEDVRVIDVTSRIVGRRRPYDLVLVGTEMVEVAVQATRYQKIASNGINRQPMAEDLAIPRTGRSRLANASRKRGGRKCP